MERLLYKRLEDFLNKLEMKVIVEEKMGESKSIHVRRKINKNFLVIDSPEYFESITEPKLNLIRKSEDYKTYISTLRTVKLSHIEEVNNLEKIDYKLRGLTRYGQMDKFIEYAEMNGFNLALVERDFSERHFYKFSDKIMYISKQENIMLYLEELYEILNEGMNRITNKGNNKIVQFFKKLLEETKKLEAKDFEDPRIIIVNTMLNEDESMKEKEKKLKIREEEAEKRFFEIIKIREEMVQDPLVKMFSKVATYIIDELLKETGYTTNSNNLKVEFISNVILKKKFQREIIGICEEELGIIFNYGFTDFISYELGKLYFMFLQEKKEIKKKKLKKIDLTDLNNDLEPICEEIRKKIEAYISNKREQQENLLIPEKKGIEEILNDFRFDIDKGTVKQLIEKKSVIESIKALNLKNLQEEEELEFFYYKLRESVVDDMYLEYREEQNEKYIEFMESKFGYKLLKDLKYI